MPRSPAQRSPSPSPSDRDGRWLSVPSGSRRHRSHPSRGSARIRPGDSATPVLHRCGTHPSGVRSRDWPCVETVPSEDEGVSVLALPARAGTRRASARSPRVSVIDTTEIRWFATGEVPRDVRRRFSAAAVAHERCDRYLLDARTDVGVKFRNGETLELKTRLETGPTVELTGGPVGVLELWRKWTPADGLVQHSASQQWISVDKWIAKRRFSLEGAELEVSPAPNGGSFCDVEIVAVHAGGTAAWSFAFAAHGPQCRRLVTIRAAWRAIQRADAPTTREVGFDRHQSMGYPEWLGRRCS